MRTSPTNMARGRSRSVARLLLAGWAAGLLGCAAPEGAFEPKPTAASAVRYCFDTVGHMPGSKPWILGGTCCCTPTQERLDQYHADGFCAGMTLEDLTALYRERSIKTALDHTCCNNACRWGPHVLKGGRCMVPATPGTRNYEEIATGIRYVPKPMDAKHKP